MITKLQVNHWNFYLKINSFVTERVRDIFFRDVVVYFTKGSINLKIRLCTELKMTEK